uniref:Uncharacterized protein AlNc14C207G8849 n=1 Tax=Albugo laibachii Nc14 TaxID=890382 RepID=F0WR41_9STRA|nr:conserved hypothetical protein [Albugo laibachii Nc14]|eukprot:CCA23801.1 conserved hypothetical protein [Albugo laibachii Nc14]
MRLQNEITQNEHDSPGTRRTLCDQNAKRYLRNRSGKNPSEMSEDGSDYETQSKSKLIMWEELGKLETSTASCEHFFIPKAQMLPFWSSKRRQLCTKLEDDASAGLSTRWRSDLLENVHPNILSRLQERNTRENPSKPLQLYTESARDTQEGLSTTFPIVWSGHNEISPEVFLEIGLDELDLDDHACLSLEDCLSSELRESYFAYADLLSRQPWTLRFSRIQAVLDEELVRPTSDLKHAVYEAMEALNEIRQLRRLYDFIICKSFELSSLKRKNEQKVSTHWLAKREEPIPLYDIMTPLLMCLEALPSSIEGKTTNNVLRELLSSIDSPCLSHIIMLPCVSQMHLESPEEGELSNNEEMGLLSESASCQDAHYRFALCGSKKTQYQFFIVLYSDNKLVAWAIAKRMKASKVDFFQAFRVQMNTFPNFVTVFLYETTASFSNLLLINRASIPLAMAISTLLTPNGIPLIIPGHLTATFKCVNDSFSTRLKPESERYQFCCPKEIPRASWHSSFLDSSRYDDAKRYTRGRLHVKTRWMIEKPTSGVEPQMLPPHKYLTKWYKPLIGHRVGFMHPMKDREPRSAALSSNWGVFRMRSLKSVAIRPGGLMAQAHENGVLTKRNQLLRMRSQMLRQHFGTSTYPINEQDLWQLSGEVSLLPTQMTPVDILKRLKDPIPLSDAEIVSQEKYLPLLRPDWKALTYKVQQQQAEEAELPQIERLSQRKAWKVQQFLQKVAEYGEDTKQPDVPRERVQTLQSIVRETPMPTFPTSLLDWDALVSSLFSRRRRLNPQKRRRLEPFVLHQPAHQCSLHVQLRKGINLPIRISSFTTLPNKKRSERARSHPRSNHEEESFSLIQLECESHYYVEIAFQGRRRRTSCASVSKTIDFDTDFGNAIGFARASSHPVWLEMLTLALQPPHNDCSPDSISRLTDTIHLSVFDQVTKTVPTPNRKSGDQQPSSELFIRESRLVGTLEIPFSALCQRNGSMDVTLRLEMSKLHLGYLNLGAVFNSQRSNTESEASESESLFRKRVRRSESEVNRDCDEDIQSMDDSNVSAYLSLTLEADPLLPSNYQRDQQSMLQDWTVQWRKSLEALSRSNTNRCYDVFVNTASGKKALMTQFLVALTPPQQLIQSNGSIQSSVLQRILWYVRMIPSLTEFPFYQRGSWDDIWCTSQEFIDLEAGNMQAHAILLCNFLSWYDLERPGHSYRNYLAIGNGTHQEKAVFVLRRRFSPRPRVWLIDASQASVVSDEDELHPPVDIAILISSQNVYANLQPLDASYLNSWSWDIENDQDSWKALFSSSKRSDALPTSIPPPIQSPKLHFSSVLEDGKQLEIQIRDTMKLEIRRWRNKRFSTVFNAEKSAELHTLLVDAEKSCGNTASKIQMSTQWLRRLQSTQNLQVNGKVQHYAFAEIQIIIKAVKSTRIHVEESEDVEFGLAVHVHPFPGNFFSSSLIRMRAFRCIWLGIVFLLSLQFEAIALVVEKHQSDSLVCFPDVKNNSLLMQSFLKMGLQRYATPRYPESEHVDWNAIFNEIGSILVWSEEPSRLYESLVFSKHCKLRFNRLPGSQVMANATLLRRHMKYSNHDDLFFNTIVPQHYILSEKAAKWLDRSKKPDKNKIDKDRYRDPMFGDRYMVRKVSRGSDKIESWAMVYDKSDITQLVEGLNTQESEMEVRQYIEPYLLDGHKFDVGIYAIVTSLQPMRIYMYPRAAIRIAKESYPVILDASTPRNAYDTSDAYTTPWEFPDLVKLKDDMALLYESETSEIPDMWGILKRYLHLRGLDSYRLQEEIENAITRTIVSTESIFVDNIEKLRRQNKPLNDSIQDRSDCLRDSFFEVFKFEFEIDRQGSPKLTEIISNPVLEASNASHMEESKYYQSLSENLIHLLGVHLHAIPATQSFLNRPHTPTFCAQRCSNTQLAWDTSCYLCPGWFPPHVGFQIYKFAHEYARRGNFQLLYPSMDNHHFQFRTHPMSEYDHAADRYIKSLSRVYSDDMEMMMMESVPICMIRAHCNRRGDCINGVCACDRGFQGSTCYQIDPTASTFGVKSQFSGTREQFLSTEDVSQSTFVLTMAFMLTLLFLHILYRSLRFRMQKYDQKQN